MKIRWIMQDGGDGLRLFLQSEIKKRGMSVRAFAEFVGVSHSTLGVYLKENVKSVPTTDFLVSVARKTGVDLVHLWALAFPDIAKEFQIDPDITALAVAINSLPQESRNVIIGVIEGMQKHSR